MVKLILVAGKVLEGGQGAEWKSIAALCAPHNKPPVGSRMRDLCMCSVIKVTVLETKMLKGGPGVDVKTAANANKP